MTSKQILILSPHMDDMVLSCFDHAVKYSVNNKVMVLTIFSHFPRNGLTKAAVNYMHLSGCQSPEQLEQVRIHEDEKAMKFGGFTYKRLNFSDAAFRRHDKNTLTRAILKEIEIYHTYDYAILPWGVGGHKDHVLTRVIAEHVFDKSKRKYYVDYPYAKYKSIWWKKWVMIRSQSIMQMSLLKKKAVQCYKSQLAQLNIQSNENFPEIII